MWSRGVVAHPRYLRLEAASISTKDGTHSPETVLAYGMAKKKLAQKLRPDVAQTAHRLTRRLPGATTVLRLLVEGGEFCSVYQDYRLQSLNCERIEADEIWTFVGAKQKNARYRSQGDI